MIEMKTLTMGGKTFEIVDATARLNVLPKVSEDGEGNLMQVIDGKWTAIPVAESTVKTYIEEYVETYIREALEGEF